ncbi:AAA-ATPase [Melia azedarach]|uniref:AAA-ATPase n=1 Tax=Melia azedarach TaxID=155640 RepID=A0ACC1X842_MELAZ|nr:AAA-ATPase [Melia azedarach]
MVTIGELWATAGSIMATLMFVSTIFKQYFPYRLWGYVERYSHKLIHFVYPYLEITFDEFCGERLKRSEVFSAIQTYLSGKASMSASRFKADIVKDNRSVVLSMDDKEEVTDEFKGVKVWWVLGKNTPRTQSFSVYPSSDERRYYKLMFHRRYRELITGSYINHVLDGGKALTVQNRQRKLYSNNPSKNWYWSRSTKWSHVFFEHPATFDTLAMETEKKEGDQERFEEVQRGKRVLRENWETLEERLSSLWSSGDWEIYHDCWHG